MAGLANFFCPGLGHLIWGMPFQALIWFVLVIAGYFLFIVPGVILHIICIVDGARAGNRQQQKMMERALRNANRDR